MYYSIIRNTDSATLRTGFKTEAEAIAYAEKRGWNTTYYYITTM